MGYYAEWITRPSDMSRWIYILRYSCLKTLARKYNSTISKVMKRFGVDRFSASTKTVEAVASIKVGNVTFEKGFKLLTYLEARDKCLEQGRWFKLLGIFRSREAGEIGLYPLKKDRPVGLAAQPQGLLALTGGPGPAPGSQAFVLSPRKISWILSAGFQRGLEPLSICLVQYVVPRVISKCITLSISEKRPIEICLK
jgi:hypothetical protein